MDNGQNTEFKRFCDKLERDRKARNKRRDYRGPHWDVAHEQRYRAKYPPLSAAAVLLPGWAQPKQRAAA